MHIAASLLAGTAATTACAPADVLKSRMQSANGKSQVWNKIAFDAKCADMSKGHHDHTERWNET